MRRDGADSERRRHLRYPLATGKRLSRVQVSSTEEVLEGRTIDVSDGGIKITLDGQVTVGEVLKCELALLDLPVLLPTLTQVRWCSQLPHKYLCGLRFVI